MASYAFLSGHPVLRSESYQRYLDELNNSGDTLIGLCAGKSELLRIQRQQTLKYFQSLPDPNKTQENEEAQPLKEEGRTPARYMLAREDSKLSNSSTSFYSAVSYQHASEENVARQAYFIQSPITADVPDLSAPHSIPAASNLKHDKVGPGPTVLIPVARPRPKRHVLDLVAACAEGTEYDRLHAKKPAEVVVELDPLTAYLAQDREVEHWDIKVWVDDCIEYGERATEAAKQPGPAPRQCKQYYLTDNFNPWRLNVQWDARAERENWNRDLALVRPRWVALPQDPRERQLALIRDQALMAQIRMVEDAHLAEEAFLEEQARIGRQEHAGRVDPVPVEPQRAIDIPQTRVDPEPAEPQRAIDISQTNVSRYPCYEIQRSAPIDIPCPRNFRSAGIGFVPGNVRRGMRIVAAAHID